MISKYQYRSVLAVSASAAGLAGLLYLLYRWKTQKSNMEVKEDEVDKTEASLEQKVNEEDCDSGQRLPVMENQFELVNSSETLEVPNEPVEVESEESAPLMVKDSVEQRKVLVLGLDRAGKTCLLSAMANEVQPQLYEATPGFNVMCITANGMDLSIWEIGGDCKYRSYWENFLKDTSVLIFVVDSTDNGRLQEVKEEIERVLAKEEMNQVPLLVVCTKQDRQTANKLTVDSIAEELNLEAIEDRKVLIRGVEVQCGGAASNKGLQELQDLITELCSP